MLRRDDVRDRRDLARSNFSIAPDDAQKFDVIASRVRNERAVERPQSRARAEACYFTRG